MQRNDDDRQWCDGDLQVILGDRKMVLCVPCQRPLPIDRTQHIAYKSRGASGQFRMFPSPENRQIPLGLAG